MRTGRPKGSRDRHGRCLRAVPLAEADRAVRGFGERLRHVCDDLDVGADELAAAVGVNRGTIRHWIAGDRVPRLVRSV